MFGRKVGENEGIKIQKAVPVLESRFGTDLDDSVRASRRDRLRKKALDEKSPRKRHLVEIGARLFRDLEADSVGKCRPIAGFFENGVH